MTASTVGRTTAERLLRDKETIARAVTASMYDAYPELLEKYGERGREKCLQDMHYNIEHLIPAVDLEDASLFAAYTKWLDGMLGARGVPTRDVRRCLELLADDTDARYGAPEASLIHDVIAAGLAVLAPAS
jgi:hypothetical protein